MIVRLLASIAALSVGVAGLVVVVVLLDRTPGPVSTAPASTAAPTSTSASPSKPAAKRRFPAPPPSAVVFTRQDVGTVLALAATPGPGRLELQASVLGPTGRGTNGLRVSFTSGGQRAAGVACGAGCYRASLPAARPRTVGVIVRGRGLDTVWRQQLPAVWPAPNATALVERAERAWRALHSLAFVEHLASDPRHAITSVWRIGAPDRAAYQVLGGYAGIVIRGHRWDRAPGGRWVESAQSEPLTQPVPVWTAVTNAHLLGSGRVGGRPVWIVSFYDPTIPAWFRVSIDRKTSRTLDTEMMATAHFMHDAYGSFDRARPITPP